MVSVIIPCYNQAHFLAESVGSVLAQSYENWECIIVDDGSTDRTEHISLSLCNTDKRIKYLRQENKGLATARNFGIGYSNEKLILPLDADDILHKDFLKETVEIILIQKQYRLVYSNTQLFGVREEVWENQFSEKEFLFRNLIPCTALYYKEDWLKAGGYNSNMHFGFEDWDFWLSLYQNGVRFFRLNKVLFYYRQQESSMMSKMDAIKTEAMIKQVALNHLKFYTDKLGDPLSITIKLNDLQRQVDLYRQSRLLLVANIIISPFRKFQSLLKKY